MSPLTSGEAAPARPASGFPFWIGCLGAVSALATLVACVVLRVPAPAAALWALAAGFAPPFALVGAPRAIALARGGLKPFDRERLLAKCVGAVSTLGLIAIAFALFPFFNRPALNWLAARAPFWLAFGAPLILAYIALVDRLVDDPEDGLAALGRACLGRAFDAPLLADFLRGLVIKLFFFSLMFFYVASDVAFYQARGLPSLAGTHQDIEKFNRLIFTLDATLAALGYLATMKLFDWQVREADGTASGWAACIVCYEPFFPALANAFLAYYSANAWRGALVEGSALYWIWAGTFIACNLAYLAATVAFGPLFSNLTRRAIITGGPYALTKHPAYLAKNAGWWIQELPGLLAGAPLDSLRRAAMLALVSGIYRARAVTEERLLSHDPVYRVYAAHIAGQGLIARIRRRLPGGRRGEAS